MFYFTTSLTPYIIEHGRGDLIYQMRSRIIPIYQAQTANEEAKCIING